MTDVKNFIFADEKKNPSVCPCYRLIQNKVEDFILEGADEDDCVEGCILSPGKVPSELCHKTTECELYQYYKKHGWIGDDRTLRTWIRNRGEISYELAAELTI